MSLIRPWCAAAGAPGELLAIASRALAVLAMLSGPVAAARAQSFTGLGTLPGETTSLATGISADGTVVVGTAGMGGNYHRAYRWTSATGMEDIGEDSPFDFANAVSGDGMVVVGVGNPDGQGNSAFRWSAATGMVRLSLLPIGTYASAYSANSDGSVITGYNYTSIGKRAVRWTSANVGGGICQNLGTLSANCGALSFSQGYGGVSADGNVVSGDSTVDGGSCSGHAFLWTSNGAGGGTMLDLGHLPGMYATDSLAFGLSANGLVAVGSSQAENNDQAFRWTAAGGMQDIGTALTAGESASEADAASADGSAVVGWASPVGVNDLHAFLWTTTLGSVDLNTYLPTLGINLSGWTLRYAKAISADGKVIAGYGDHDGLPEAWIVSLRTPCAADYDHDGQVAPADVAAFINTWFTSLQAGTLAGDFNGDGAVTPADVALFVNTWFAALTGGC